MVLGVFRGVLEGFCGCLEVFWRVFGGVQRGLGGG